MIPESVKQAGWHPDPDVPNRWRYWTGHDWSKDPAEAPKDDGFAQLASAPVNHTLIAPPFQNTVTQHPGLLSAEAKKMFLTAIACVFGFFLFTPLAIVLGIKFAGMLLF